MGYHEMVKRPQDLSTARFWNEIYESNEKPRWDLGGAAPPLEGLFSSPDFPLTPPARIAVLGCGWGNEVALAVSHGFETVGFDFAPLAIEGAKKLVTDPKATFVCADFFEAAKDPQYMGTFDAVIEHTSFVAIQPERRAEYARVIHQLLKPEGWLFALFYNHGKPDGPPFDTSRADVDKYFAHLFEFNYIEKATNSIERRAGKEWLAMFRKRPDAGSRAT